MNAIKARISKKNKHAINMDPIKKMDFYDQKQNWIKSYGSLLNKCYLAHVKKKVKMCSHKKKIAT